MNTAPGDRSRSGTLAAAEAQNLLATLQARFEKNALRHPNLVWEKIEAKLTADPQKLWSLGEMEKTGGEPDVIGQDEKTGAYLFADCSAESPAGRRSLCFDDAAWAARKQNKPAGSASRMADQMGILLMSEDEYRQLQALGEFDTKTSSWIKTPESIRQLGGALFGDRRYGTVFVYHNGADSYYAARGFRGSVRV